VILEKIICQCSECDCHRQFESIDLDDIMQVIQLGSMSPERIEFAKKRLGSTICENCFVGKHL